METGGDFLRSQVNDAVVLHGSFVEALRDHGRDAGDPRFSELCARYMPIMEEHQRQLEELRNALGSAGIRGKVMGKMVGVARGLADVAREDDYRRLVGDIAMSSMAEDVFRTFHEAGRILRDQKLAELGTLGERRHDDFNRDAGRLAQAMFVERARPGRDEGERERKGRDGSRGRTGTRAAS